MELSTVKIEEIATNDQLSQAFDATLEAWSVSLDRRDRTATGHTQRVTKWAVALARMVGVSEQELGDIRRGAILHDFGNITVPESILHKKGELTVDEWITIHIHPYAAYELLGHIPYLRPALEIPYRHHEHWDGSGYPKGLKGEQIPLSARLFSVVDVFDSLTSERPYRSAWKIDDAIQYIEVMAGKLFDPKIVKAFLSMIRGDENTD
jgi:HD-GYP domain-containing protein (c-di-GMP phosphodiesterase class II)